MDPKSIRIADYSYTLPPECIALHPLPRRDDARLLIYRGEVAGEDLYRHAGHYLPSDTLLVLNDTRVLSARIPFVKPSGGGIEVFVLGPASELPGGMATLLESAGRAACQCLVGGVSKWKSGLILDRQLGGDQAIRLQAEMAGRIGEAWHINFRWTPEELRFSQVLAAAGEIPLPPYLNRAAESSDQTRYQTVYAQEEGSVAAPTAGLHFTEEVFADLDRRHIARSFVTLHVGAGTFRPVKAERMVDHVMHQEYIDVDRSFIEKLRNHSGPVYAVGTTSLRTLESLYWMGSRLLNGRHSDDASIPEVDQWEPYEPGNDTVATTRQALDALLAWMDRTRRSRMVTKTGLLIVPGYTFRVVRGLFTNFHQPASTLLLLVAALAGPGWRELYDHALSSGFRFLSYGDGCLIDGVRTSD